MEQKSIITPKSKVLQVIEDYPQLEEVLINYVPVFKNLNNPILRKTVAKVATLQQAAAIANVKVEELVNHLRKEVGQDLFAQSAEHNYITEKPDWFDEKLIKGKLNAKELLDRGEHPVNMVIAEIKALPDNSIYMLEAPFLPAPLIDKASSLLYKHWVLKESENSYIIYFYKI
ncbi:MAG: DUF1858 domain-containing protein [Bacteroidetes bacterium]|nr:DUF1858 domain-containing protein [Bacteroidota bacterium]